MIYRSKFFVYKFDKGRWCAISKRGVYVEAVRHSREAALIDARRKYKQAMVLVREGRFRQEHDYFWDGDE